MQSIESADYLIYADTCLVKNGGTSSLSIEMQKMKGPHY